MKNRMAHKFMSVRGLGAGVIMASFLLPTLFGNALSAEPQKVRLGYFEGGKYPYHDRLKDEFFRQLNAILPDSIEAVFAPEGYRSAEWDKSVSARMAGELAGVKTIDLMVAQGPWVVKDLLNAGFKKPIVGIHQLTPQYEGLLDKSGRPNAANLTIHYQRNKIESDLTKLASLVRLKKLGLLFFPSSNETDSVLARAKAVGERLGFEVVTTTGDNAKGTYAFFNAYGKLEKNIDALYIGPLWGCDIQMINQFLYNTDYDKIPVMTSEDKYLVERGAFISNNAYGIYSEARFNAYKAAQIILGKRPNELPCEFTGGTALAVNEAAAKKSRITLERSIYNEADVVLATAGDDVPRLSLNDAIGRAVTFNPSYQAQKEAVEAAVFAASQAYTEYLPHLTATTGFGYRDDNYVNNSRNELSNEYYATELKLRQKIFSLETIKSIKIAAKERDVQMTAGREAQINLEAAVTQAFLNYLKAEEVLKLRYRLRELVDRNIEITGTRHLAEKGDEYEFSRWRSERDKSTFGIVEASKNLRVARILLNTLLNYPAEQNLVLSGSDYATEATMKTHYNNYEKLANQTGAERISQLLAGMASTGNFAVRRREQSIEIQKLLLGQNKSRYWPTLDFGITYRHADELSDSPPPFKEESSSWTLGGVINFPIFLGSDRIREKRKLRAQLEELEYRRDETKLGVSGEIQQTFQRFLSSFDNLPVAYRRLEKSQAALRMAVEKNDAAKLEVFGLVSQLEDLQDAELTALLTRYEFYAAMADIVRLLGWSAYESGNEFTGEFWKIVNQF